jgi:hypothetical protein
LLPGLIAASVCITLDIGLPLGDLTSLPRPLITPCVHSRVCSSSSSTTMLVVMIQLPIPDTYQGNCDHSSHVATATATTACKFHMFATSQEPRCSIHSCKHLNSKYSSSSISIASCDTTTALPATAHGMANQSSQTTSKQHAVNTVQLYRCESVIKAKWVAYSKR